jgi:hypothetical protein
MFKLVGRNSIELTEKSIKNAVANVKLKYGYVREKFVAEELNVSYPVYLREKQRLGLDPKTIELTPRNKFFEKAEWTEESFFKELDDIDENTAKTVGYNYFKFKFEESIIVYFFGDSHIGADTTIHKEIGKIIKICHDNPNVKLIWTGDYIDNFGKYGPGGGVHQQAISITKQKEMAEWIAGYLKGKILGVIQGCHEEFSYNADGFDFGKYLANKCDARYLGKQAIVELEVGENTYKILVDHNERWFSNDNLCHGLKQVCRKYIDFDLGVGSHDHVPNAENTFIRGKMVKTMKTSSFKKPDRFIDKIKTPATPILSQCYVMLAEKIEPYWLGIVYFEDIRHALRFL